MTTNQVIETLREKASSDPISNAVLHLWALRKRTRNEVTINGLHAKMKMEGFIHSKWQYEPLLKLMAQLGLGRLQMNSKGHIVALKDIKTTLQSLGRAVCDKSAPLSVKSYRPKNQYEPLAVAFTAMAEPSPAPPKVEHTGEITVTLDAKSMTFPITSDLTEEEITYLVGKFIKVFRFPLRSVKVI